LAHKNADMIKAKLRRDVLEAWASLHGLSSVGLVRVNGLDAVAGPTQRDSHIGQRVLLRGRLLVLSHLLGMSKGALQPATYGRLKTSHPFRVVRVVNSTLGNRFWVSAGILLNLTD
jgi:hypothetical protein